MSLDSKTARSETPEE